MVYFLDQFLRVYCGPGPVLEAEERQIRAKTRVRGTKRTL